MRSLPAWLLMVVCAPAWADFIVGTGTHFAFNMGTPEQVVPLLREAGIKSFRDEFFWADVETEKGVLKIPSKFAAVERAIDLAVKEGIEPLIVLDYGNKHYDGGKQPRSDEAQAAYARYCAFVVKHFKGRVRHFEIWNEWNAHGSALDYARLLAQAYPAIKQANPSAVVLGGAVEGADRTLYWIDDLLRAGALKHMDGLSVHPYVFWKGEKGTPEYLAAWMDKLHKTTLKHSAGKPVDVYVTEIGWSTNVGELGVSEARAADFLARVFLLMRSLPYVRGAWWYNFQNKGDNAAHREHNFGLVTQTYQRKPAFDAMRQVAKLATSAEFVGQFEAGAEVRAMKFRAADGEQVVAMWHATGKSARVSVATEKKSRSASANLNSKRMGANSDAAAEPANDVIEATSTPVLVSPEPGAGAITSVKRVD